MPVMTWKEFKEYIESQGVSQGVTMEKEYLGDSVYIKPWDFGFVLTTENGFEPSNRIYLEPEVIEKLLAYINRGKDATNV